MPLDSKDAVDPVKNEPPQNDPGQDNSSQTGKANPFKIDEGHTTGSSEDPRDGGPEKDPTIQGGVAVGSVTGDGHTVAGVIDNSKQTTAYHEEQHHYVVGLNEKFAQGLLSGPTQLKVQHFERFDRERLLTVTKKIVANPQELSHLGEFFGRRRLIILSGRHALGKGSLALKLAAQLCETLGVLEVRRSRLPLSRHLAIDLPTLLRKHSELQNSVLILDQAFRYSNRDLLRLAESTDPLALGNWDARLQKAGSLLILVCDEDHLPPVHPALGERIQKVAGPTTAQLRSHLRRSARKRIQKDRRDLSETLNTLLTRYGSEIVESLSSIPQIESFLRDQLIPLLEDPDQSITAALREAARLDHWLLDEQARNLHNLAYVLALVLCHAGPPEQPIRWLHFERLRQHLFHHLRSELGQSEEPLVPQDLCREPSLLQRLGVEVLSDADLGGPTIRFQDVDRADKLWHCLVGNGRQLGNQMLTPLLELIQHDEYYLRLRAGWAIGRLSLLDPYGIFGRLFFRWSQSSQHQDALGALCLGALSAGPPLEGLTKLRLRNALRDASYQRVEAAILALGVVGQLDLTFATAELRQVVTKRLAPRLVPLKKWEARRRQQQGKLQRLTRGYGRGLRSAISSLQDQWLEDELARLLPHLFPAGRESKLLGASQYSLVGLCFDHGTQPIFSRLMRWLPAGKEAKLGPIMALLFLHGGGIFEILERYPIQVDNDEEVGETWSPTLASAGQASGGVSELSNFLFALYLGIAEFPRVLGSALTMRWLGLIESWTRSSAKGTLYRDATIELWNHLLKLPDSKLRRQLQRLLHHPELSSTSPALSRLVKDIIQSSADSAPSLSAAPKY